VYTLVHWAHFDGCWPGTPAQLTENRRGLIVETDVRAPGYHAERDASRAG